MPTDRILLLLGIGCMVATVAGVLTGIATVLPIVALALAIVGLGALVAAWRLAGTEGSETDGSAPPVSTRATWWGTLGLGLMGLVTLAVALVVAEGEASGHAIGHLVIGLASLTLFAVLGFGWRPPVGSQPALLRRVVLVLLGLASFGSFLESIGGAGYDATNAEARLPALTAFHDVALPIAALGMPGLVLGTVVGVVVALTGWRRRRAHEPAGG